MASSDPGGPQRASDGATPGQAGPPTHSQEGSSGHGAAPRPQLHHPGHYQGDFPSHPHEARPSGGKGVRLRRSGAGGRWWLWLGRAVLWAAILVVAFNGVRTPIVRALQSDGSSTSGQASGGGQSYGQDGTAYPGAAASAYALGFARVYLSYNQSSPDKRASRLARYLPKGVDAQLGWGGKGKLSLEAVEVAGVTARDATHGVVTLSVLLGDRPMRLAVPVYAKGDTMAISGQPALMPAPERARLPHSGDRPPADSEAEKELSRQLPGFFQAFAGSDTEPLERYLAPGASLTGFSGAVRFVSLDDVYVPQGSGGTRHVTATVTWRVPVGDKARAGELQQTYRLTVAKRGDRWYVKDVQGAEMTGFS